MDDDEYHPSFSSPTYQVPLSDGTDVSSPNETPSGSGWGYHNETTNNWNTVITPRQRNRNRGYIERTSLRTPVSPLNRDTYTLQEENEASFSSSTRLLRFQGTHSARSMDNSTSTYRELDAASVGGGSTVTGGGSTMGGGSMSNVDSPHTPSNASLNKTLGRDNSLMQLSIVDGTVREVALMDGGLKDPPLRPMETPNSAMGRTSLSSHGAASNMASANAASMISAESTHSHSVAGNTYSEPPRDDDEAGDASSVELDRTYEPIVLCGVKLPIWLSRILHEPPSTARISVLVVRFAPCFWCCGDSVQATSTDRAVLTRLIMLCVICSTLQMTGAVWLFSELLILDDEKGLLTGFAPNFWNMNGAALTVGVLGMAIIVSCFFTMRVIRVVDLVGAIRYLWVLLWIVPFEIFFNISLFDYHRVTRVWIHKWWSDDTMSFFRWQFCESETHDSACKVPILGGPDYESEEDWCQDMYPEFAPDGCSNMRDKAQSRMLEVMLYYYTALGGVGCVLLALLLLIINTLERIISKPIVQKSRESNVPAWLTLPTTVGAVVGSVFLFSPSSLLRSSIDDTDRSWIGILYLMSSALFLVAALMGWFLSTFSIRNSADKKRKNVAVNVFIGIMAANCVMIASLFVASFTMTGVLNAKPIDEGARGSVACYVDRDISCTNCDPSHADIDRCPEWEKDDVTRILKTQLKQSATVAAILILYGISVLRFGFGLRRHLSMYEIDYV